SQPAIFITGRGRLCIRKFSRLHITNGQTGLSIGCGLTTELQVKQEFLARLSIRGCWTITSGTGASPGRSSAEIWPQAPTDHDHANRLYGTQDVTTIFATVEFCWQPACHGMA